MIILEFLKAHMNRGLRPDFYFFRDAHGNEIDLLVRKGGRFTPSEIKSAATFTPDFLKGIERFRNLLGRRCTGGVVVYDGAEPFTIRGTQVLNPLVHAQAAGLFSR